MNKELGLEYIKPIKKNSKFYKLAFFVMRKGIVFYEDLVLYCFTFCEDKSEVYKLIRESIKRGYIEIKIKEHKTGVNKVKEDRNVRLTDIGFAMVGIHLTPQKQNMLAKIRHKAKGNNSKREARLIELNHIKTFFNCASVQTEDFNKPSLEQIHQIMSYPPNQELTENEQVIKEQIAKGLYYTDIEVRAFNRNTIKFKHSADSENLSSIFKGIYLNDNKVLVVYAQPKYKSKMVYVKYDEHENRLVKFLKYVFAYHEISALVLGNQDSIVVSTAEGRKYGLHNDNVSPNYTLPLIYPDNKIVMSLYSYLYVLDINHATVDLLRNTLNSKKVLDDFVSRITRDGKGQWNYIGGKFFYTGSDGIKTPAVFMPYYELMKLKEIKEDTKSTPVIICSKSQVETIQHITHKEHLYIDYQTLKPIKANIKIYDEKGNVKGKRMILDYLNSRQLTAREKDINELGTKFNLTQIDFFNSVAKGEILPEDAVAKLQTSPKVKKVKDSYTKGTTIWIDDDLYAEMKEYAEQNHKTMKWCAKQLILNKH